MKTIFLIFCFLPILVNAQINDGFSDGNFSENPSWTGNTDDFEINQQLQLQLKSSGSDTSVLFTRNNRIQETELNWWMKLSFNTSANNYARIYFVADTHEVNKISRALYLQVGGGDDSVSVYSQINNSCKKILSVPVYKTDNSVNYLRIKIISLDQGIWNVYIDTTGGSSFFTAGTFTDSTFHDTHWFGFFCKYTSSNAAKFYFDDVYAGPVQRDTICPKIISTEMLNNKELEINYSEIPEKNAAENPKHYVIASCGENPVKVIQIQDRPSTVLLTFNRILPERTCDSLRVNDLKDISGNEIHDTIIRFCCFHPLVHEILINEILADPDPVVGLPEGEFIELYNTTLFPVSMKDWSLSFGNNKKIFSSVQIEPLGYLIIAKDSAYLSYGRCSWLFTSSSSVSNEGTQLVLRDPEQRIIHTIKFDPDWYQESLKSEGGWSLEMKDPGNPCGCSDNWSFSKHPLGGTPGSQNSVFQNQPDEIIPYLTEAFIRDTNLMEVRFSESMDSISLLKNKILITEPEEFIPEDLHLVSPSYQSVILRFQKNFDTGIVYQIKTDPGLMDCAGNSIDESKAIRCALPNRVEKNDLVINEFLPDPFSGGDRFVELYNRSEKVINLESLIISDEDTIRNILNGGHPVEQQGSLLFPGEYRVLTSSSRNIQQNYWCPNPENFTQMASFPIFRDDSGTLVLARKWDQLVIDRVKYNSDMHFPLLISHEGVSLERYHPDRPSGEFANWHSSAETNGYATPGYLNSHRYQTENSAIEIEVLPTVFSPDNDGFNDLLSLTLRNIRPDQPVTITIFDQRGRQIKHLANNILPAESAVFIWDGTTDDRQKAAIGIYLVHLEFTAEDGTPKSLKKAVILAGI